MTVEDSLFLMKSTLARWVFTSIQVMKYLKFPINGSKGLHRSETMRSPTLDGSFSSSQHGSEATLRFIVPHWFAVKDSPLAMSILMGGIKCME